MRCDEYIERINTLMKSTEDIMLLDLIYKILVKSEAAYGIH